MIPLNKRQLRRIIREWVSHYNRGRPHSRLCPGIPDSRSAPPPRKRRTTLMKRRESRQLPCWVHFTMNVHSNEPPHSHRSDFLRTTAGVDLPEPLYWNCVACKFRFSTTTGSRINPRLPARITRVTNVTNSRLAKPLSCVILLLRHAGPEGPCDSGTED